MGAVVAIDALLHERRVWRGQPAALPPSAQPTGFAPLDAALPTGGWPEGALSELLIPVDGAGELQLLWPALARLSQAGERIVLVAPPYVPFAPAWRAAGIELQMLQVVETASGVTFVTLEDEHGMINVVVWRQVAEQQRRPFLESRLLMVEGKLEAENGVRHLIAKRLHDLTPLLSSLDVWSRDFR